MTVTNSITQNGSLEIANFEANTEMKKFSTCLQREVSLFHNKVKEVKAKDVLLARDGIGKDYSLHLKFPKICAIFIENNVWQTNSDFKSPLNNKMIFTANLSKIFDLKNFPNHVVNKIKEIINKKENDNGMTTYGILQNTRFDPYLKECQTNFVGIFDYDSESLMSDEELQKKFAIFQDKLECTAKQINDALIGDYEPSYEMINEEENSRLAEIALKMAQASKANTSFPLFDNLANLAKELLEDGTELEMNGKTIENYPLSYRKFYYNKTASEINSTEYNYNIGVRKEGIGFVLSYQMLPQFPFTEISSERVEKFVNKAKEGSDNIAHNGSISLKPSIGSASGIDGAYSFIANTETSRNGLNSERLVGILKDFRKSCMDEYKSWAV